MNHDVIQKQQYMDLIHTRPRTAATPARCDRMSHPCRELGSPAREMTVSERYGKTENKTTAKGGAPRGGAFPLARGPGAEPRRGLGAEPQPRGGVGGVRANAPNRRRRTSKYQGARGIPPHMRNGKSLRSAGAATCWGVGAYSWVSMGVSRVGENEKMDGRAYPPLADSAPGASY